MISENRYVTPTYQSILILGLDTVARRLANNDVWGCWQALKTLYTELPPECQQDCAQDLADVKADLSKIHSSIRGINLYMLHVRRVVAVERYLARSNFLLFDKFKNSLFQHGYLENTTVKPRNLEPSALGE